MSASTKTAQAEARRRKLLNMGADRLAAITGEPASKSALSSSQSTESLAAQATSSALPQQAEGDFSEGRHQAGPAPDAAAQTTRQPEQLPAQLRHRGHAAQSGSQQDDDLLTPPQTDAATMSREPSRHGQDDASGRAEKLAALARGQANSSEVLSCAVRATSGARLLLAAFLAVLLTDLPWSLDFARNRLGLALPIQAAWHRMPPLVLLALAELVLIGTALVLFVCNPDLIKDQVCVWAMRACSHKPGRWEKGGGTCAQCCKVEADAFTLAADGGGLLMKVLGCLPNGRAKAVVWKARLQLFGSLWDNLALFIVTASLVTALQHHGHIEPGENVLS